MRPANLQQRWQCRNSRADGDQPYAAGSRSGCSSRPNEGWKQQPLLAWFQHSTPAMALARCQSRILKAPQWLRQESRPQRADPPSFRGWNRRGELADIVDAEL